MATRNSREVQEWINSHQGKHFCACGCGRLILIKRHQLYHGIPKVIRGHLGNPTKVGSLAWEREAWAEQERGKHFCQCGCGRPVAVHPAQFYTRITRYVRGHHPNSRVGPDYKNTLKDFWKQVEKTSGCWNWTGQTNNKGYGLYQYHGRKWTVHQLSYEIHHGSRKGLFVCHHCDNTRCVRPDHLFLGSQVDNMQDAAIKGRMAKKVSVEIVEKIVSLVTEGMTRKEAAQLVGVSHALACKIMDGSVWSQVTRIKKKPRKYYGR